MDLAVDVDAQDADKSGGLLVASAQGRLGLDRRAIGRAGERRPAVAIVVLGVQVSDKVDRSHHPMVGSCGAARRRDAAARPT